MLIRGVSLSAKVVIMSNKQINNIGYSKLELLNIMKIGYQEMGNLNISLSEEGLCRDIEDFKEYEKNLLESE